MMHHLSKTQNQLFVFIHKLVLGGKNAAPSMLAVTLVQSDVYHVTEDDWLRQ